MSAAAIERLKTICARTFAGHGPVMTDGCISEAARLLQHNNGIAVGEVHGDYAHARFMKALLPKAAAMGVRHMYVEMFRQSRQDMLDRWQDDGDPQDLMAHINRQRFGYSTYNWVHYWDVLEVARQSGIRVTTIEPDEIPAPRHPGLIMMTRNIAWQKRIDQSQMEAPGKYILYCGQGHLEARECGGRSTMQAMMNISGIFLKRGLPGFMPAMRTPDLHHCWVPKAPDQTPISGMQITLSAKIGAPMPAPPVLCA